MTPLAYAHEVGVLQADQVTSDNTADGVGIPDTLLAELAHDHGQVLMARGSVPRTCALQASFGRI